ncbi:hypothetical protein Q1695_001105 [Nippostrongylus brasiliensis]|nr:hypothetical protein Q1695_001105 [Nippostrongylus brasiliensis]
MVTSNSIPRVPSFDGSTFYRPNVQSFTYEHKFKQYIEKKFNVQLDTYHDLHKWSCDNYADFWESVLLFADVKLGSNYTEVVDKSKQISDIPQWFRGATLNYTENCLRGKDEDVAFISASVNRELVFHTYAKLRSDITRLATALREFGVVSGDVACGFLPNSYETSVAMFAVAAIGATWASASVDFGPSGVLDRFRQVKPKILFTVEAVTYKGKRFDLKEKLDRIVSGLPTIQKVVQFNNLNSVIDFSLYEHGEKYESMETFLNSVKAVPTPFVFEQVPFSHPLFIMFSSGTTGVPKAMVHTVGAVIGSISGGTDIIGCFVGCSLSLPVYPGECQCLYLGMNIKAFDANGHAVEDRQGELVCLTPFPSMPSHFLGDVAHARYRKAYFERFEGVWAHGDYCEIRSATGGVVMLGRSDATLNRGGVRIGTAEIYSIVESFSEIDDSVVAGQLVPDFDDEHILLFVRMAADYTLTETLRRRICTQIRTMMSPRHVPNAIHVVKDIPLSIPVSLIVTLEDLFILGSEATIEQFDCLNNSFLSAELCVFVSLFLACHRDQL